MELPFQIGGVVMDVKVLIADNNVSSSGNLIDALIANGIDIHSASSAADVYTKVDEVDYAAIVVGELLSDMHGLVCANRIHREYSEFIPIIVLSHLNDRLVACNNSPELRSLERISVEKGSERLVKRVLELVESYRLRKQAETELQNLASNPIHLQSVLDALPEPMLICSQQGQFLYINQAMQSMFSSYGGDFKSIDELTEYLLATDESGDVLDGDSFHSSM